MKNKLNFKIVGSGPTGLLLSIALSKFDCNIFLTDLLTKDRLIDKDKTYAITHSTRKILSKFRLWEKLEPFLFGFDTLSISDSVTSAFTNLSTSDLDDDISSAENIGWVVKHSDLMNVFFQEIDRFVIEEVTVSDIERVSKPNKYGSKFSQRPNLDNIFLVE